MAQEGQQGRVGKVGDRHARPARRQSVKHATHAPAEFGRRQRRACCARPAHEVERVLVADPQEQERRRQLLHPLHLRELARIERRAEQQELQHVACGHVLPGLETPGERLGVERLQHGGDVLPRHRQVAGNLRRAVPESHPPVSREANLSRVEPSVAVGVDDDEGWGQPWQIYQRLGQRDVGLPRDQCRGTVDLTRGTLPDEAARAGAGEEPVTDCCEPPESRGGRSGATPPLAVGAGALRGGCWHVEPQHREHRQCTGGREHPTRGTYMTTSAHSRDPRPLGFPAGETKYL